MLGGTASAEPIDGIAQDLWGVGCLMYKMLTGHRLFAAIGTSKMQAAITRNLHDDLGILSILFPATLGILDHALTGTQYAVCAHFACLCHSAVGIRCALPTGNTLQRCDVFG